MRKLSKWARQNPWYARITIVLSYIVLNALGFFIGKAFLDWHLKISGFLIYPICFLFLFLLAFYPLKRNREQYKNYFRTQKMFDFFLVASSFILIICYSNQSISFTSPFNGSTALAVEPASVYKIEKTISIKKNKKSFSKQMRQHLKKMYSKIKHEYKTSTRGEKIALITLSVIVALILMYLVAAISCNLSCSGADGAAVVVLLLGFGAIIYFLIKIIQRISRGKPLPKAETSENTSS
ncbi:MAG: hypothetical protein M3413_06790 [Bacteroidota bacterium]|nr:hypothetical protein [Bacteroidota bacterium]